MISPRLSIARLRDGVCIVLIASFLSGCSSESGMDFSDLWQVAKMSIGSDNQKVTLQQAASIPYASIGISVGENPQQILVLASANSQQQLWTSASRIAIMTEAGRIVRTAGLPQNLSGYTSRTGQQASPAGGTSISYLVDFADIGAYSVEVSCRATSISSQSITILGTDIQTERIDEQCLAPNIGWSFTNRYWIDPTSKTVWRSIQYIHPKSEPIAIDTLRPIAG